MVDSSGHGGTALSSDAHLTLSGLAFLQYQEVIHKFAALRSAICKSLIDRKVSVKEFVRVLNNLGAYAPQSGHSQKSLFDNHLKEFKKAKTISDALLFLAEDSSFLEYHIFEHIASELGSPNDQALVREYKGHLDSYCTRNILECPSYSFGKVEYITLYLKARPELENRSISQLQYGFHSQIAQVLGVANYTLCLLSVARDQGCVQLMYQLPRFVKETVFPLSGQQEVALEAAGVLELTCESYQMSAVPNNYHAAYPPHVLPPGSTTSPYTSNGSMTKATNSTSQADSQQRGYQAEGGGRKGAGRRGRGGVWSRKSASGKASVVQNDVQVSDSNSTGVDSSKERAELLANQFLATPTGKGMDGPSTSGQLPTQFSPTTSRGGVGVSNAMTSSPLHPGAPPPPLLYSNPALHLSSDIAALMPGIQGFGAAHSLLGAPSGLGRYSPSPSGGEGGHSEIDRDHHGPGGSPNHDTD